MRRRQLALIVGLALVFIALATGIASAEYQGSDVWDNVGPANPLRGETLADRHPLSAYNLDFHVTIKTNPAPGILGGDGGVDLSGLPALVMHAVAGVIWEITKFLMNLAITLFAFAFSLDLLNGSPETGGQGALQPVVEATQTIHREVFGDEWMAVGVVLVGIWGLWSALVRRRISQTFGELAMSLACMLLASWIVFSPNQTVGYVSKVSDQMSAAFLAVSTAGTVDRPEEAKRTVANQLFKTFIYDPFVVLNFGGIEHCVDAENRPVKVKSPDCKHRINNKRKYAERFLSAGGYNSKRRDLEYEAIKNGRSPSPNDIREADADPRAFENYRLSDADKSAVDIQQEGGASQRLMTAIVIGLGSLGVIALLGALAVTIVLAKVLALVLLAFGAIAMVAAIFPGRGRGAFKVWASKLWMALFRKAWYSLILAVLMAVSTALMRASSDLGWFMAYGLQCFFFWSILLYRREVYRALARAMMPGAADEHGRFSTKLAGAYYGSRMLQPVTRRLGAGGKALGSAGLAVGGKTTGLAGLLPGQAARAGAGVAGGYAANGVTRGLTAATLTNLYSAGASGNGKAAPNGTSATDRRLAAVTELADEHDRTAAAVLAEQERRDRVTRLTERGQRATAAERQELDALRRQNGMDDATYDRKRTEVEIVERDIAAGRLPFSERELKHKEHQIANRRKANNDLQSELAEERERFKRRRKDQT